MLFHLILTLTMLQDTTITPILEMGKLGAGSVGSTAKVTYQRSS